MLRSFGDWAPSGFLCLLVCLFNYHLITLSHCLDYSHLPGLSGNSVSGLSHQCNTLISTDSLPGSDPTRIPNKFHCHQLQGMDSPQKIDTAKMVKEEDSTLLPLWTPHFLFPPAMVSCLFLRQLLTTQTL